MNKMIFSLLLPSLLLSASSFAGGYEPKCKTAVDQLLGVWGLGSLESPHGRYVSSQEFRVGYNGLVDDFSFNNDHTKAFTTESGEFLNESQFRKFVKKEQGEKHFFAGYTHEREGVYDQSVTIHPTKSGGEIIGRDGYYRYSDRGNTSFSLKHGRLRTIELDASCHLKSVSFPQVKLPEVEIVRRYNQYGNERVFTVSASQCASAGSAIANTKGGDRARRDAVAHVFAPGNIEDITDEMVDVVSENCKHGAIIAGLIGASPEKHSAHVDHSTGKSSTATDARQ